MRFSTIIEALNFYALNKPSVTAFTFIGANGSEESLSFSELLSDIRSLAKDILKKANKGDRAILFYPSGLEYIKAFYACLYVGVIAVPLYPPRPKQKTNRIDSVVTNCQPKLILYSEEVKKPVEEFLSFTSVASEISCLQTGKDQKSGTASNQDIFEPLDPGAIAFLQYTSGSTGDPKGVMISHKNVMANLTAITQVGKANESDIFVNWLPLFHDLGLVFVVLLPVGLGAHSVFMAPTSFARAPLSWLIAISKYRGTASAAPNFGYDLCVERAGEIPDMDLSCWRVAINAAEPVNPQTIDNFSNTFEDSGFKKYVCYPGYGMAEATVFVSGGDLFKEAPVLTVDKRLLGENKVEIRAALKEVNSTTRLVGCGAAPPHHSIAIVNAEGESLGDCSIGEICVSGPSVSSGYWGMEETNQYTFNMPVKNGASGDGYLKTGDLGFICHGELYICGRIKDLIILRGANYYPQDIETLAGAAHRSLNSGSCAAFSIEDGGVERLILAIEIRPVFIKRIAHSPVIIKDIADKVNMSILSQFDIVPDEIVFLRPGTIPKTSSGKIQRSRTRAQYLEGSLTLIESVSGKLERRNHEYLEPESTEEKLLCDLWREILNVERICITDNFFFLGGDSISLVSLAAKIESTFKKSISLADLASATTIQLQAELIVNSNGTSEEFVELTPDHSSRYEPFPLTDVQKAYWLGRQPGYELGNVATYTYTEHPFINVNSSRIESTINLLIQRHDMLRMTVGDDGQQCVLKEVPRYQLKCYDFRDLSQTEITKNIFALREEMSHQVLPADCWPLFDFRLSLINKQEALLHVGMDLLFLDGASLNILANEFASLYEDPSSLLEPLSLNFRDYVLAEKSLLNTNSYSRSREYWASRVATFPGSPVLPLLNDPANIKIPRFERRHKSLNEDKWRRFKELSRYYQVTPTVALLSCLGEVINLWSAKPHFALNLTLFNRLALHPEVDRVVGDFTNLNLLEFDYRSNKVKFCEKLQKIQTQLLTDLQHRLFGGVEMQRLIATENGQVVHYPIVFTSTLGLGKRVEALDSHSLNYSSSNTLMAGYGISQTSQVSLDVQVFEQGDGIGFNWDSVKDLFPEMLIENMFTAFSNLIDELCEDPILWTNEKVSALPSADLELITNVNAVKFKYSPGLLHGPLISQLANNRNKIAIRTVDHKISYEILCSASQVLARRLRDDGAKPNQLIAIVMDKGWEQIIAALGILSSGAAYLPIDASQPIDRIKKLLSLGKVAQVITTNSYAAIVPDNYCVHIVEDSILTTPIEDQIVSLSPVQPSDIAYVIFTSGSTGEPKGVTISHQAALNTILTINSCYNINENDCVFGLSNLNFDLSVYDIFGVLGAGGTLVLPQACEYRQPKAWIPYLVSSADFSGVTVWNTVPALAQLLIDEVERQSVKLELRLVMMSGDWIPLNLASRIPKALPGVNQVSLGGATEVSIWSIHHPISDIDPAWSSIPYGQALPNQQVYVMKADLSLAPVWVTGDIYIGGVGLAEGYWCDPEKTASSFIKHPETGNRLYKTGDCGRVLPDGNIEFQGRIDQQLKIRGHRIEPGEIEAKLKEHSLIKDSVVIAKKIHSGYELVAYVVEEVDANKAVTSNNLDKMFEFKTQQKGVTHGDGEVLSLPKIIDEFIPVAVGERQVSIDKNNVTSNISITTVGDLLRPFYRKSFPELPFPKAFYPSGGSLYPVQVFVRLGSRCYYYQPLKHQLILVNTLGEDESTPLKIYFIANFDAIEPVYGIFSEQLCRLEAGYMAQILIGSQLTDISVEKTLFNDVEYIEGLEKAFGLDSRHKILYEFEGRELRKNDDLTKTSFLTYSSRKSYRCYSDEIPKLDELLDCLSSMDDHHTSNSGCTCYVYLRRPFIGSDNEVYGYGSYKYDHVTQYLEPISNGFSGLICTGENARVEMSGSFMVMFSAEVGNATNTLYSVGFTSHSLMVKGLKHSIGFCAIGAVSNAEAKKLLLLDENEVIVHSLVGGRVSSQQVEEIRSEKPRVDMTKHLAEFLKGLLPEYMVPGFFVEIPEIPLTANGKVNRKALPDPNEIYERKYISPRDETETRLCEIWQELLGIEKIGISDNFFHLGGHSLLAIQIAEKIQNEMGCSLPLQKVFTLLTIEQLAAEVKVQREIANVRLSPKSDVLADEVEFEI